MSAGSKTRGVRLTSDLSSEDAIPYFLWDQPITLGELRKRLKENGEERNRLLGKILREAREREVWLFTTPQEVAGNWKTLEPFLGRRRDFWKFLLETWRELGLLQ